MMSKLFPSTEQITTIFKHQKRIAALCITIFTANHYFQVTHQNKPGIVSLLRNTNVHGIPCTANLSDLTFANLQAILPI